MGNSVILIVVFFKTYLGLTLPLEFIQKDVCQFESFQHKCWQGDIIVVESAEYGRMATGRCVEIDDEHAVYKNDQKWIGCSVDVTQTLARKCTGKDECDVLVNDNSLGIVSRPCYKGLMMYLSVKYQCVSVIPNGNNCNLPISSESRVFLFPFSKQSISRCGTVEQPWLLEAPAGQRLDVYGKLLASENDVQHMDKCASNGPDAKIKVGHWIEKTLEVKPNSLCLASKLGEAYYFQSKGNSIEIGINALKEDPTANNSFLLFEIRAIGCLDLIPPEDAWLKRKNDEATVGCYSSRQTWQLRCNGHQWTGVIGNCSMGKLVDENKIENSMNQSSSNQGLVLVAVCGLGVVTCLMIICCGILCVKKISYKQKKELENFQTMNPGLINNATALNGGTLLIARADKHGYNQQQYNFTAKEDNFNFPDDSAYFVLDQEGLAKSEIVN